MLQLFLDYLFYLLLVILFYSRLILNVLLNAHLIIFFYLICPPFAHFFRQLSAFIQFFDCDKFFHVLAHAFSLLKVQDLTLGDGREGVAAEGTY